MLIRLLAFALSFLPLAVQPMLLLKAARVFDGEILLTEWSVRIKGNRIEAAGPSVDRVSAKVVNLGNVTLMPGLMHVLLHAHNEVLWTDQVARQGVALRTAHATNHLRATPARGLHHRPRPGHQRRCVAGAAPKSIGITSGN